MAVTEIAMIALILVTCLASGADCRAHVAAEGMSSMQCMVQSQIAGAQYVSENPKRRVTGMVCTDMRRVPYFIGRNQA